MFHVERLEVKDAGLGVWKGNGAAAGGEMGGCGEEGELSAGGDASACGRESGFHIIDGAEGDGLE